MEGMGKRAIVKYAIKYCVNRNVFSDGAYWIPCLKKSTTLTFQQQLLKCNCCGCDDTDDIETFYQMVKHR